VRLSRLKNKSAWKISMPCERLEAVARRADHKTSESKRDEF